MVLYFLSDLNLLTGDHVNATFWAKCDGWLIDFFSGDHFAQDIGNTIDGGFDEFFSFFFCA